MSKLDDIFEGLTLRVTSEVPAQNRLVIVEDKENIKQDVKEFFSALGDSIMTDSKTRAKWRRKVAEL